MSDIARDTKSQGTQTEALDAKVEEIEENKGYKKRRHGRHQGSSKGKVAGDQGWGLMRLGVISCFIFTNYLEE